MATNDVLVSVIIPMFNEEQTVSNVIESLKVAMKKIDVRYEIIVVDDCSTDKSFEISKSHKVKVYSLKKHRGKGYALNVGFAKAKGEIIATIDSDGSHSPEELPNLLNPVLQDKADLVIGSRFLREKPVSTKKLNEFGVRLFNVLIKFLTRVEVSDSQSGYRVVKSDVLRTLCLRSDEYEIESEMLVKTAQRGFRVREVPISFKQRTYGKSRLDPIVDGFKILISILDAYVKG